MATPPPEAHSAVDDDEAGARVHESGRGVLVHGLGGEDEVLRELDAIAAAVEQSSTTGQSEPRTARRFDSPDEFRALVQRVTRQKAKVALRKVFLYLGECNVEQEIWIKDPDNPDASAKPHKAYAIVHAHHHARVTAVEHVKPEHLAMVHAMNARHLAADGRGGRYQGNNPFFNTYIEPSGNTLKVFPHEATWTCSVCRQSNWQTEPSCRGQRGSPCRGVRPCSAWTWRRQKSRDEGLALILECADTTLQWKSGSVEDRARGGDGMRVGHEHVFAGRLDAEVRDEAWPPARPYHKDCAVRQVPSVFVRRNVQQLVRHARRRAVHRH